MDENKQIEEMAEAVVGSAIVSNVEINNKVAINLNDFVKNMIRIGYRKQSDTIREFVQKLFDMSKEQAKGGVYTIKSWTENIIKLAKEYGVEDEQ